MSSIWGQHSWTWAWNGYIRLSRQQRQQNRVERHGARWQCVQISVRLPIFAVVRNWATDCGGRISVCATRHWKRMFQRVGCSKWRWILVFYRYVVSTNTFGCLSVFNVCEASACAVSTRFFPNGSFSVIFVMPTAARLSVLFLSFRPFGYLASCLMGGQLNILHVTPERGSRVLQNFIAWYILSVTILCFRASVTLGTRGLKKIACQVWHVWRTFS